MIEVQRFRGAVVQRCRGAEVQRCRGALRFRGAVAKGAPEVEWCRSAEVQVKRCRGVEVQRFRSSEVQKCRNSRVAERQWWRIERGQRRCECRGALEVTIAEVRLQRCSCRGVQRCG